MHQYYFCNAYFTHFKWYKILGRKYFAKDRRIKKLKKIKRKIK